MTRIRLVKLVQGEKEHDVAIIPVTPEQSKVLAENFNGWPAAVVHASGVYLLEDWDNTEAVFVYCTHITANGEGFKLPSTWVPDAPATEPPASTPTPTTT